MARNFDEHIASEHDEWKYVYYISYLKKTGENDLSGLEYFVWTQFEQKKTEWIPIGNTLYMTSDSSEQLEELDNKMTRIDLHVSVVKQNLDLISSAIQAISQL
jgi:hypothetical protein